MNQLLLKLKSINENKDGYRRKQKHIEKESLKFLSSFKKCFFFQFVFERIRGALSSLRQFLPNEIPLKIMRNAFCFNVKAL